MSKAWFSSPGVAVAAVLTVIALAVPVSAQEPAEDGSGAGFPEAAKRPKRKKPIPLHLSLGGGVFEPWDGDRGYSVSASVHAGLGSDRFWVGGEFEYRRYEAEVKRVFSPDMNSFLIRFSFQYHPFPAWVVSPYCGVQVGIAVHQAADLSDDTGNVAREKVSGGLTLLGLAGAEVPLFTSRLHFFAEGRLGNTSDLWKRKGGNWQVDQVDGITGMGGLRFRF